MLYLQISFPQCNKKVFLTFISLCSTFVVLYVQNCIHLFIKGHKCSRIKMSVNDTSLFMPLMVNSSTRIKMNVTTFISFCILRTCFSYNTIIPRRVGKKASKRNKNFLAIKVVYVFYMVQDT